MNIYSFGSIIASIFCFSLGSFIFAKKYEDRRCRYFGLASIFTGFWTLFPFVLSRAPDSVVATHFARLIYIPAAFNAPLWIHFMLVVTKEKWQQKEKIILGASYLCACAFLPFVFNLHFIEGVNRFAPHFSVIPGPLYIFFVVMFGTGFTYAIATTFTSFRVSVGYKRNQLKFILTSFIFGFLSGIIHFYAAYFNKEFFPHDFLLIAYTGIIAYAIFKYRLMDITVVFTRTGIFVAVYTLVLGLPFLVGVLGKYWLIGAFDLNWWLVPLVLLAVLAVAGPYAYIYLQKRAEEVLLREQRRYQDTLKQAARELASIHSFRKLLHMITHIVTKTVRISHAVIYFYDEGSSSFRLEASRNLQKGQALSIEKQSPLIGWLEKNREVLIYEEIKRKSQDETNPLYPILEQQMRFLNASLIVPGFLKDRFLGFLALGNKLSGKFYSNDDLNTFSVLANQAVLAIENALLYDNMEHQIKERTQKLFDVQNQLIQAEKLATVGTLAGGVAHEINNPLTAILTNVQMLLMSDETLDTDSKESLQLIEEATKRCRTIVQKLMTYAKKPLEQSEISRIDLRNVVEKVTAFLEYQLHQDNIRVLVEKKEHLYPVLGNQNELEQVLTNLILNAKDAIKHVKRGGDIHIALANNSEWAYLAVRDEGIGMSKETIAKIFDPFFTTKDVGKGTGLGLSICQSIVSKHNGVIDVLSEPGKGATFTVKLPKAKSNVSVKHTSDKEKKDGKEHPAY